MTSIRRFLILVSLAVITLVNFVAAIQGYRSGLASTESLFDAKLMENAVTLAELISQPGEAPRALSESSQVMYQIFDDAGNMVQRSSLAPTTPIRNLAPGFSSVNYNGIRWRVFTTGRLPSGRTVLVAESSDNRYFLAEGIILKTVIPILLGLPALMLLVWFIVTRGLKPLQDLTTEVASKKPQDLTPIHQSAVPAELQPLLEAMNDLLARLSESFDREKRFSGDAAHELRTPLSALKINLFNLRKQLPRDNPDMLAMDESITRMGHLIEQMLLLYRLSPEQFRSGFTHVDLYAIAQQVIAENYTSIESRHQEIELEGESAGLTGNAFAFSTLIKNLVDNANKYTPEGGRIQVSVHAANGLVKLVVEDSGPGIPDILIDRVRERFYRVHGDRNPSQIQGCGLGLSIVQHIVDLHRGQVLMQASPLLGGLRVEVSLPVTAGDQ